MKEKAMRGNILPVVKGVLLAYMMLAALSLLGALLAWLCGLGNSYYHSVAAVCIILSLFAGGFGAARAGAEKGWLKGLCVGGVAALIMLFISLAQPLYTREVLSGMIYFLIAAGIGGICGVK